MFFLKCAITTAKLHNATYDILVKRKKFNVGDAPLRVPQNGRDAQGCVPYGKYIVLRLQKM